MTASPPTVRTPDPHVDGSRSFSAGISAELAAPFIILIVLGACAWLHMFAPDVQRGRPVVLAWN